MVFLSDWYTSDDNFAFITLSSNTLHPKKSDTFFIMPLLSFCRNLKTKRQGCLSQHVSCTIKDILAF
jgi:hypothetical protein